MNQHEVEASGDSAEVLAAKGDRVMVRLPENPTTGYIWEMPGGVEIVSSDFREGDGGAGASGERIVTLIAGEVPVNASFKLTRPWENAAPDRVFMLRIRPRD